MKTSKLVGPALDWAVAKCEGHELMLFDQLWKDNAARKGYPSLDVEQHLQWQHQKGQHVIVELRHLQLDQRNPENLTPTRCAVDIPNYSTNWSQGGPIIEREGILLRPVRKEGHPLDGQWLAMYDGGNTGSMVQWVKRQGWHKHYWGGPTPLIAAMRAYVASKLGEKVEIPEELM